MIDYSILPEHMQEAAKAYIEEGRPPGTFLHYIFSNNLVQAVGAADHINLRSLLFYIRFLYEEAPIGCWGSEEKVADWIDHEGLSGLPNPLIDNENQ